MLEGILIETNLSTAFSALSDRGSDLFTPISVEQGSSLFSDDQISILVGRIQAIPLKTDVPIFFKTFADWVARLQTNQALADDFEEAVEVNELLPPRIDHRFTKVKTRPDTDDPLLSKQVGYAIAGIFSDDDLLSDPA